MKQYLRKPGVRLALEIGLVLLALALVLIPMATQRAKASPAVSVALYWYVCNSPSHIAVFANRVHIYCGSTTKVGTTSTDIPFVHYFAVSTSNQAEAARFLSLLQTAEITGRDIWVQANPTDDSGTSFNCYYSDCRHMYSMEMR